MLKPKTTGPQQCIFCQVAAHESPAQIEYEDADVMGFWDVNPKAPVHVLVIPKKHITSVLELEDQDVTLVGKMVLAAKKVAEKKKISENGYRLVINVGRHSGQIVEHIHLHLLGGKQLGTMV